MALSPTGDEKAGAGSPAASEAVLAALRESDPITIASWVRSETPRLLAVARRMLRNDEDAKDAVQDGSMSARAHRFLRIGSRAKPRRKNNGATST